MRGASTDLNGLRQSKTVNGVRTTHVWDAWGNIAMELNAQGAVTDRIIRSVNGRLIRSDLHGWYLKNVRGDVVQRVNDARVVQRVYRYSAFGIEHLPSANNTNNFRFAGEYFDRETGNYYLRARFFNPRTGRFTQPDPHWYTGNMIFGDSPTMRNRRFMPNAAAILQSGNLYVFTINNPIRWVDPTGLFLREAAERIGDAVRRGIERVYQVFNSPTIVSREDWGAITTAIRTPFSNNPVSIVIHHTAGGASETINSIDRWHRYNVPWTDSRGVLRHGWDGGIGYNFVIGRDGTIYEGRGLNYIGTHAGERNSTSIGIGIMGDFSDGSMPSELQFNSLNWLVNNIRTEVPYITTITNHASWCPPSHVVDHLETQWTNFVRWGG